MAKFDQTWSVRSHFSFLSSLCIDLLSGHEMDVRNLSFESESFDIAIDKGALSQSCAKYFHRNIW